MGVRHRTQGSVMSGRFFHLPPSMANNRCSSPDGWLSSSTLDNTRYMCDRRTRWANSAPIWRASRRRIAPRVRTTSIPQRSTQKSKDTQKKRVAPRAPRVRRCTSCATLDKPERTSWQWPIPRHTASVF